MSLIYHNHWKSPYLRQKQHRLKCHTFITRKTVFKKAGKYTSIWNWNGIMTIRWRGNPIIQNVPLVVKSTQGYFLNRINNNLVIEGLELKHGLGYLFFREEALFEKVMMQRFFFTHLATPLELCFFPPMKSMFYNLDLIQTTSLRTLPWRELYPL